MRTRLILLSLFCLSSCGPRWISDIKPPEMLQRDVSECELYAHEKFPPKLYSTQEIEYQNIEIESSKQSSCGHTHHGHVSSSCGMQQDKSKNISIPVAKMVTKDANATARSHAFDKCMMTNGWTKTY